MEIIKKLSINGATYSLSDCLVVTITDDTASHTSAEIYAHAGTVVLHHEDALWTLDSCTQACAIFTSNIPEEGVFYSINIYEDGSWERFQFACPTEYRINSLIDAKLGVIENGSY